MNITREVLARMNTNDSHMKSHTFVFNYNGKHRSDLKESQHAKASVEIMKRYDELHRNV